MIFVQLCLLSVSVYLLYSNDSHFTTYSVSKSISGHFCVLLNSSIQCQICLDALNGSTSIVAMPTNNYMLPFTHILYKYIKYHRIESIWSSVYNTNTSTNVRYQGAFSILLLFPLRKAILLLLCFLWLQLME